MFGQPVQFGNGSPLLKNVIGLRPPMIGVPMQQGIPMLGQAQQQVPRAVQLQQQMPMQTLSQTQPIQQAQPLQAQPILAQTMPPQTLRPQAGLQPTFRPFGVQVPIGLRPVTLRSVQGVRSFAPSTPQQEPQPQTPSDPQIQKLKDLRQSSGLKHIPVNSALLTFKNAAQDGKLTKDQFIQAYQKQLIDASLEIPNVDTQSNVFEMFDHDNNGVVDMMELICGISLLCQGSEEQKIRAVFDAFDENGDGFISMDEMFKFLTSVFKVVLTPSVVQGMKTMGVEAESPEDLASVTSLECFKVADLNGDGKLSIQEFNNWFYAPKHDPTYVFSPMRKLLH
eukprot:GEMP01010413.1.p1 GENE.GEMP01010413.1~~GEMP01010413.1.p1  ORF type:complete len:337 (+),score=80.41 GEMP01010413.1:170-1180(+)